MLTEAFYGCEEFVLFFSFIIILEAMHIFSLCLVSFVFFLGEYIYITPHYYSLSEKLMAALIVTRKCGANC